LDDDVLLRDTLFLFWYDDEDSDDVLLVPINRHSNEEELLELARMDVLEYSHGVKPTTFMT
jgi:hypothetical protein